MVAAVSTTINPKAGPEQNLRRPPLLPSESDNALAPRRPKSREVTSRYKSSLSSACSNSTSKRCESPLNSRTAASSAVMTPKHSAAMVAKRSQSAERRRPATPRPLDLRIGNGNGGGRGAEMTNAQKMLSTSTRSLSVSFQWESFSLRVSKAKPAPPQTPSGVRKGTPERRKALPPDQAENSKLVELQRWPGRLRQTNSMSKSVDCTDERKRVGRSGNVVGTLQNSMADNRVLNNGRLCSGLGNEGLETAVELDVAGNSAVGSNGQCDTTASDTESVSSGSTVGAPDCGGGGQGKRGPRGIMVPARFWQETNNRLRRVSEPCSPVSKNNGLKPAASPKLIVPKMLSTDSPASSPRGVLNSRGLSSPIRVTARPASPSKLAMSRTSSPMRGMSPSRMRNSLAGAVSSNLSNTPSIVSFAADIRGGKTGENRDAHLLRLLYSRLLQWRFVNARADDTLSTQKMNAEKSLYSAWVRTTKLRESVRAKRIELQLLRQNLKLISILKGQMIYMEEWSLMDRDYSSSLRGAAEALQASTLRLPVVSGARADVQKVNDAVCSAVDVMRAMASSICSLLPKVDEVNSLVTELTNISAKECALLDQCKDLLSTVAAIQVKDCSLRTHILQLKRVSLLFKPDNTSVKLV